MRNIHIYFGFVIILLFLSGCQYFESLNNPLIGTWRGTAPLIGIEETITFKTDGIAYFHNELDGTRLFSYNLSEDGELEFINLENEKKWNVEVKIIGNFNAIKIRGITYTKG